MKQYLDADDIFLITEQGFDFFHEQFGVRYPLPKYDQLYVPEFNAGAMENFGCVVHGEQYYIFRSRGHRLRVREPREHDPARDGAHVVRRPRHHALVGRPVAERVVRRVGEPLGQRATPPGSATRGRRSCRSARTGATARTSCPRPTRSTATCRTWRAVEVNFDGITYAKGASVIKQLVAYVGIDAFVAGLRDYFGKHAWGNATFGDLLDVAGGRVRDRAARLRRAVAGDRTGQHAATGGRR